MFKYIVSDNEGNLYNKHSVSSYEEAKKTAREWTEEVHSSEEGAEIGVYRLTDVFSVTFVATTKHTKEK